MPWKWVSVNVESVKDEFPAGLVLVSKRCELVKMEYPIFIKNTGKLLVFAIEVQYELEGLSSGLGLFLFIRENYLGCCNFSSSVFYIICVVFSST